MTGFAIWLSQEAVRDRRRLDARQDRKLLWWAQRLRENVAVGDQIPRRLIPERLRRAYALENLWRLELPGGWRALYTVVTSPDEPPTVGIVRIMNHKEYDRLFGYSTS